MQYTQTQIKERPILFSGGMVRAILDGRKTQTRRVAKLTASGRIKEPGRQRNWHPDDPECLNGCPYGKPGDRLYVRETWQHIYGHEESESWEMPHVKWHEVDGWLEGPAPKERPGDGQTFYEANDAQSQYHSELKETGDHWPWRPSIHMPRWASRILLEITDVRVERLQDISEEDAREEGYESREDFLSGEWAREILKKYGNAWVWAITIKRIG